MRSSAPLVCVSMIVGTLLLQACASSTLITSMPEGAVVYVDGQRLGEAPVTVKDTALAGAAKTVVLKRDGYHNATGTIRKEETNAGRIVSCILVIPCLWVLGYPDQYVFELEPLPATAPKPPDVPDTTPSP